MRKSWYIWHWLLGHSAGRHNGRIKARPFGDGEGRIKERGELLVDFLRRKWCQESQRASIEWQDGRAIALKKRVDVQKSAISTDGDYEVNTRGTNLVWVKSSDTGIPLGNERVNIDSYRLA